MVGPSLDSPDKGLATLPEGINSVCVQATPGLPHDSIFAEEQVARNGQQVHNEYVVFRSNQVYPEFIIWYSV